MLKNSSRSIGQRIAGTSLFACVLLLGQPASRRVAAQTQPPSSPPPAQTPSGMTTLPQGPPPTGLLAPLPPPALPIPKADKPALSSPGPNALPAGVSAHPITIDEAVALALATNKSLALAGETLLHAQGITQEARAAFNPTLGTAFTYTHLNQGTTANFGGQTITIQQAEQPQLNVQATLPLDIAGMLRAATDQAKFQEIAARLDINRTRNQLVLDVKNAFYNVLRDQALVTVATEALQNAQDRLDDAQKKFKAGTAAHFDVTLAQTEVANAQQQLIQARSAVSVDTASLNNTIGIDVNTPLQVSSQGAIERPPGVAPPNMTPLTPEGAAPGPAAPPANPPPAAPQNAPNANAASPQAKTATTVFDTLNLGPEYNAILAESLQSRPEILEADAGIAAARKGILLAQRSQLPTLALSWALTYTPNVGAFAPPTPSWEAVAQLNIAIFDGGVARARARQARALVSTAETTRRQTVDQVTLEVRQAYLNLVQAQDRVAVASQSLDEARETYRLARVRYTAGVADQAGISPLIEISNAQAALTQAESNLVSALYDYNNARAQLDRAVGRYSYVSNGPGYAAPPPPKTTGSTGRGEHP